MPTNFVAKSRQSIPRLLSGHAVEQRSVELFGHLCWCRRTDELVDGPGAELTTPETLTDGKLS